VLFAKDSENLVYQFLAGTFHQDTESPEDALLNILVEEDKEYLEDAIVFLKEFINSEHSRAEKNEYIEYCADGVYFPDIQLEPIEWLSNVTEQIKRGVGV